MKNKQIVENIENIDDTLSSIETKLNDTKNKLRTMGFPNSEELAKNIVSNAYPTDEKLTEVGSEKVHRRKPESRYDFDFDVNTSYDSIRFASDVEDLVDKLKDVVEAKRDLFRYHEEMAEMIKEKLYWAVMDSYDAYRRAQGGNIDETEDEIIGRGIEAGMNPEVSNYEDEQSLINQLSDKYLNRNKPEDINYGEELNDLPFESIKPKMTKNDLIESVVGKKTRKIIKNVKVKDLKK